MDTKSHIIVSDSEILADAFTHWALHGREMKVKMNMHEMKGGERYDAIKL